MKKRSLIPLLIITFILMPSIVKCIPSTPRASDFDEQYDNMLDKDVEKEMNCTYEDDTTGTDMKNNGMFQSLISDSVEANAGSCQYKLEHDSKCQNELYYDEYGDYGVVDSELKARANYTIIQTGILNIDMDRGPLHSGGKYKFDISYINSIRYYVDNVSSQEIPTSNKIIVLEPELECDTAGNCQEKKQTICRGNPYFLELTDCEENGYELVDVNVCEEKEVSLRLATDNCPTTINTDFAKDAAEAAAKAKIDNLGNSTVTITVPADSNKVEYNSRGNIVTKQLDPNKWECEPIKKLALNSSEDELIEVEDGSSLDSENEWVSRCKYKLDAKLDLNSANVFYNTNTTPDSGVFKENENYYYIPLKYPTAELDNPEHEDIRYKVTANLTNLSGISDIDWSAKYECAIEVKQLMYDLENGGFLFTYRPILIAMPFPDSGNNREPGKNWITWWEKSSNQQKLADSYSNLEYAIDLSPTEMRDIKAYNKEQIENSGKNLGYLDYSINKNGTSNFISSYFQDGRQTSDYNELGEFEGEDD